MNAFKFFTHTFALAIGVSFTSSHVLSEEPDFNPRVVLRRPMRAIVDAPFVPAAKATDKIVTDNELVLGVVVDGQARAYPINMITGPSREIINDSLGRKAIAATW